jgi:hypothetical protein
MAMVEAMVEQGREAAGSRRLPASKLLLGMMLSLRDLNVLGRLKL